MQTRAHFPWVTPYYLYWIASFSSTSSLSCLVLCLIPEDASGSKSPRTFTYYSVFLPSFFSFLFRSSKVNFIPEQELRIVIYRMVVLQGMAVSSLMSGSSGFVSLVVF